MDDRLAARRLRALADDAGAAVGARLLRRDRLQRHLLLRRSEAERRAEVARRGGSRDPQDLREARHPAARAGDPRRRRARQPRGGGRRVRFGLGGDHLQEGARRGGGDLLLDLRGDSRVPRPGAQVPRHGRAGVGQLLRHAQRGRVHGRDVRLRAQGRALPDGAVDLLPHQREEHRPVRAHADHRRRGPRSRPARPSPGSTRPASCAATARAASSTRSRCRTACSRWIPARR